MVQTKSYEYYTHRERPYLPTKRLREGDVRSTEHDSSGQETGFYPWFQMLFGTSGIAGHPYLILELNNTVFTTPLPYDLFGKLPEDGRVVLKVIMKGEYLSFFFNDLLIYNIKNNANSSFTKHGMITNNANLFATECFTILMH